MKRRKAIAMQRFKSTGYSYVAGKVPLTGIGVTQICNYGMQDSGKAVAKRGVISAGY